jgi:hypothetical protein
VDTIVVEFIENPGCKGDVEADEEYRWKALSIGALQCALIDPSKGV